MGSGVSHRAAAEFPRLISIQILHNSNDPWVHEDTCQRWYATKALRPSNRRRIVGMKSANDPECSSRR